MGARGSQPTTYDCGIHGYLTAAQISELANINQSTVYDRAAKGIRGEALCAPVKARKDCYEQRADKAASWPVPAQDLTEQLDCVRLRKWAKGLANTESRLVPALGMPVMGMREVA